MPEYNQLLSQRYNNLVTKLFGLEESPGVGAVAPEIVPVAIVEGENLETRFLKDELVASARIFLTAGAATLGHIAFTNPIASGRLCTITHLRMRSSTAGDSAFVGEKGDAVPLATSEAGFSVDPRRLSNPSSALAGRLSSVLVAAGAISAFDTLQFFSAVEWDTRIHPEGYYVVGPGRGIIIRQNTFLASVELIIRWRERNARPEET